MSTVERSGLCDLSSVFFCIGRGEGVNGRCVPRRRHLHSPAVDAPSRRLVQLEKAQRETNARLAAIEDSFARVVEVLDAHARLFEQLEEAIAGVSARVDRLMAILMRTGK